MFFLPLCGGLVLRDVVWLFVLRVAMWVLRVTAMCGSFVSVVRVGVHFFARVCPCLLCVLVCACTCLSVTMNELALYVPYCACTCSCTASRRFVPIAL